MTKYFVIFPVNRVVFLLEISEAQLFFLKLKALNLVLSRKVLKRGGIVGSGEVIGRGGRCLIA